jgi:hypothetical protein
MTYKRTYREQFETQLLCCVARRRSKEAFGLEGFLTFWDQMQSARSYAAMPAASESQVLWCEERLGG